MPLTCSTGVGLFGQSGLIHNPDKVMNLWKEISLLHWLCFSAFTVFSMGFSLAIRLFLPVTGDAVQPCTTHRGKINGPWYLKQQLIFLQRLGLGRAKQCVLSVWKKGLLFLEASIWIFLNPKLWAFCIQKTKMWPQQVEEGVQAQELVGIIAYAFE